MKQSGNYITKEKKEALELELKDSKSNKRKDILAMLEYAKSLGDLSENAEYHQAREDQGKLEARIQQIEQILRESEVVKGGGTDTIEIGSKILVKKEGEKDEKEYEMVGSEESDMSLGKISNRSPFGQAFFGKKKGDSVSLKTPNGVVDYKIINVS